MQRIAVVTGGSRGIGAGIAEALCREGYFTVLGYHRHAEAAEALAARLADAGRGGAVARACDVRSEGSVHDFIGYAESLGETELLVNCAGVALIRQLQDTTAAEWDELFSANTRGSFLCCREAAKGMIARKRGRIVNISSMWGIAGASCEAAYSASKAAVIGLTKSLAKELGPCGITVNCIAPGVIDTDMNRGLSLADLGALCEQTPLGRIGTPADVAEAVLFFARAGFVTGQTLAVDGGFIL